MTKTAELKIVSKTHINIFCFLIFSAQSFISDKANLRPKYDKYSFYMQRRHLRQILYKILNA